MLNINELRRDKINEAIELLQIKDGLLFGTDALILADFITREKMGAYKIGLEFGAGSGVISLLLSVRNKINLIYAIEIQEMYAELTKINCCRNNINNVKIINQDLKKYEELYYNGEKLKAHSFDVIFSNPPYIKAENTGILSERDYKNIARREISCDIFDVVKASARLLKNGGDLFLVYRAERLESLFAAMRENNITPKRLDFVYSVNSKKENCAKNNYASLVVVKARQGAGEGIKVGQIFL